MTVTFGRIVYPLDSANNEHAARSLAKHLKERKGLDTELVEYKNQYFVLTSGDARAARSIQDRYEAKATEVMNDIEQGTFFRTEGKGTPTMVSSKDAVRIIGGGQSDWDGLGAGPEGFARDFSTAGKGAQIDQAAEQAVRQLKRLLGNAQLWFPNEKNNVVKKEFVYEGSKRGELINALLGEGQWPDVREKVSGIVRQLSNERFQARQTQQGRWA